MRVLIYSFAILVVGALFAHYMRHDPGYVLISYDKVSIEMSLALFSIVALFSMISLYYVLRLLGVIGRTPKRMKKWSHSRKENRASKSLNKGLIAQAEGKWHQAERALVAQADNSANPMINYLAAAKAANAQGATDRVNRYIKLAHQFAPKNEIAIDITKIELLLENDKDEEALATLLDLRKSNPKNARLVALLAETYKRLEEWEKIVELFPDLRRRKALELDAFLTLEVQTFHGLLQHALENGDPQKIRQTWTQIPKHLQQDVDFLSIYVRSLILHKESSVTEALLREAIIRKWDAQLVYLYGSIEGVNLVKQLEFAERMLTTHEDDATLLFTLGRLCMKKQLWGKARAYLDQAIALEPSAEKYQTLANLLEETGNSEAAAECYRKGLGVMTQSGMESEQGVNVEGRTPVMVAPVH